MVECTITGFVARDIRFPTSLELHGSDAMHTAPDYSTAYVTLVTDCEYSGHGHAFTAGKGTEIVCSAIRSLSHLVVGKKLQYIVDNFASFWRTLTSDSQIRWIGPEKGAIHLAAAAIVNAVWDMWAKMEGKPLWKLLSDMEPEKLVSVIDFRYITDVISKDEALELLETMQSGKTARENEIQQIGYPAYTTSAGWLGYEDEDAKKKLKMYQEEGFKNFKMKVGTNLEDDKRRAAFIRQQVGPDGHLMMDANQVWSVQESIDWMKELAVYKPLWIEEPTSPDDILGHAAIAKALNPLGIAVATGECASNRVMFKQFLQADALQYCQIDACRLAGVNEILSVLLMAAKFGVPVCSHAISLLAKIILFIMFSARLSPCWWGWSVRELVQHLSIFDYICISGSLENRMIEYAHHLHEHMVYPVKMNGATYVPPQGPGYSTEIKQQTLDDYTYPSGQVWQQLFEQGKFQAPQ